MAPPRFPCLILIPTVLVWLFGAMPLFAGQPRAAMLTPKAFEPGEGPSILVGGVVLSETSVEPVTISWSTENGTALAGVDYTAASGTLTIPPGEVFAPIEITLLPDSLLEEDETFSILVTAITGALPETHSVMISLLDTEPMSVVAASHPRVWEKAPGVEMEIQLFPAKGRVASVQVAPDPGTLLNPFYPNNYAIPGTDWTKSPFTVSDTRYSSTNHTLTARGDGLEEEAETGLFRFSVNPGTISANYIPRLTDSFSNFADLKMPSTDGSWAAAMMLNNDVASEILLYRKVKGPPETWKRQASILPEAVGLSSWTGVWTKLRGSRLVALKSSTNEAWFFRLNADATPPWVVEAHVTGLPELSWSGDRTDFDGESLVISTRDRKLFFVNRGKAGAWDSPQTFTLHTDNSLGETRLHLDSSRLVYHTTGQTTANGIHFLERMGPSWEPWRRLSSLVPETGTVASILMHRETLAVTYHRSIRPTTILTLKDSTSWHSPVFLDGAAAFLNRGIILEQEDSSHNYHIAFKNPQSNNSWERRPIGIRYFRVAMDFHNGVLFHCNLSYDTELSIEEPGADFTIVDHDTFRIEASIPGGAAAWAEPAAKTTLQEVQISGSPYGVPYDVIVPFRIISGGTATPGKDFQPVEGTVLLKPSSYDVHFRVPLHPDTEVEGTETVRVELGPVTYGTAETKDFSLADAPPASIFKVLPPASDPFVPEPAEGTADYAIPFRLARPVATATAVSYQFRLISPGAGASDAEMSLTPQTLTLAAGASIIPVPLRVKADKIAENPEPLTVEVLSIGSAALAQPVQTLVTIDDLPAPGSNPDHFETPENTVLGFQSGRNVLANDTAGVESVKPGRSPAFGLVEWNQDGTFRYTPPVNFIGLDRFAYLTGTVTGTGTAFTLPGPPQWRWLHPLNGSDPATTIPRFRTEWMAPSFDDSAWKSGGSGLMGYGVLGTGTGLPIDTDIGTPPAGRRYTAYFRTTLDVDGEQAPGLTVDFSCDDSAVFYLNGVEIGRYAEPPAGAFLTTPDTYFLLCSTFHDAGEEILIRTMEFPAAQLREGANTFAVSVHNQYEISSDLGLKITRIDAGRKSTPTYVSINVSDSGATPVTAADAYTIPANTPVNSHLIGGSLYLNDGLLSPKGVAYDPVLELQTQGGAGSVAVDKDTGHFTMSPPKDFYGTTSFTYRVRDKDGWSPETEVILSIAPSRAYDAWREESFPGGSNSPDGLPEGDEDRDGMNNLMEFVLLRDPLVPDFREPLRLNWENGIWKLRFGVRWGTAQEATLDVEKSAHPNSAPWSRVARLSFSTLSSIADGITVSTDVNVGLNTFYYELSIPDDGSPRAFYRLRINKERNVISP